MSRWQWVLDSLAAAAAMLAFAVISSVLIHAAGKPELIDASRVPVPWVPLGIAVGLLVYRGADRWPGAFVGSFATTLWVANFPLPAALVQATSATLCALGIRALLRLWRVQVSIERWQDPLLLWFVAACGATVLACTAGTVVLFAAGLQPQHLGAGVARAMIDTHGLPIISWPLVRLVSCWWANWTSGVALVVPALRLLNRASWPLLGHRLRELAIIALLVAAWGIAAFAPLPWVACLPLAIFALVLVTWSAIRFGAAVAALIPLALALIQSAAFVADRGPLHAQPDLAILFVWAFIAVVSIVGMLITSLLAERDVAANRQAASEARYRSLFESNPQPLWVQDPNTLRILMVNEAAVRHYGYTREEFSGLRVTDLEAHEVPAASADGASELIFDGREHLCRTRDGTLINVELRAEPIEFEGRELALVFSYDVTDRNRLRSAYLDASDLAARRLGHELHDGLGQELVALSLMISSERTRVARGETPSIETLDLIDGIAKRAVITCRTIAQGLSALAETGGHLPGALQRLVERFGAEGGPAISVLIENEAALVLSQSARDHVYRIAQEALANVVKHAGAARIEVQLVVTPTDVVLTIRDDGVGLPPAAERASGLGLASMQHRAAAIGARLSVRTRYEGGTEVRLECPQGTPATAKRRWIGGRHGAVGKG
ncbi:MAG: PAS domain S-box protein [Steroidobacteraceae bacterium]